jgi:hypothetical protein
MQKMRQHQPCRTSADDADLGSHCSSLIDCDDACRRADGKGMEAGILGLFAGTMVAERFTNPAAG